MIGFLPPAAGASPPPAPCSRVRSAVRSAGVITSNVTPTLSTPATAPTRCLHLVLEIGLHGAAGNRQRDRHVHMRAGDIDAPHHVELDHAAADLGVDHPNQCFTDLILGNHWVKS